MTSRPKIAYLCDWSPLDKNSYSGGNHRIFTALQDHVGDVTLLDAGWGRAEALRKLCYALPDAVNLRLRWRLHLLLSRVIARNVHRQLMRDRFDVLFCAYSFQSLASVRVPPRMLSVFTADATPTTYKRSEVGQSFGSWLSLSRRLDPLVLKEETKIFRAVDLNLWPTEWLKSGADSLYALSDAQSVVVPWGANIDPPPRRDVMPKLSKGAPVRLLMIGRDFFAKGGPMVVDVLKSLRADGIAAQLDIIGGEPPEDFLTDGVTAHGPLNKAVPDELAQFQELITRAHFLVQPSFESYGFAFCEASAYGLPSLCLRVGGIPVRDRVNGHAFPTGTPASEFAACIAGYLDDPTAYDALRHTARVEFEERLNWDAWGRQVALQIADAQTQSKDWT